MSFSASSSAFSNGQRIPRRYTRDADNVSPPIEWRDPPPGTRSFALDVPRLDLPPTARAEDVQRAAQSHAIAETGIVGTYER